MQNMNLSVQIENSPFQPSINSEDTDMIKVVLKFKFCEGSIRQLKPGSEAGCQEVQ